MLNIDLKTIEELKEKKKIFIIAEKLSKNVSLSEKEKNILYKEWYKISEKKIEEIYDKIDFFKIFRNDNRSLPDEAIKKYLSVSLKYIKDFSEYSKDYKTKVIITLISEVIIPNYKIDMKFYPLLLGRFSKIDWSFFSYQVRNENELIMIKDQGFNIPWNVVSCNIKLSESFMKHYKDQLNWKGISEFQDFSEEFLNEFLEYLDLDIIEKRIKREMECE